jgi:hypothetical protein
VGRGALMKKPPYIFETWLPKLIGARGIVIYPFILVVDKSDDELMRHEQVHVKRIKSDGWIQFYIKYLYYQIRYGYDKNPYEVEAKGISPVTQKNNVSN